MDYTQAMTYINGFTHSGEPVKDLSRIEGLLSALGDPQKKLRFVHIAGTNGKGSVLEYSSDILIEAGYKTGQFTSPYVETYCDRIRINGVNIPENAVGEICGTVSAAVKGKKYSQFEITFAIALIYFLRENCDIVFLETGIGGDLDATNAISSPAVSVITSISLDHIKILGDTVEEIAAHKLGIIKSGCPAVISCDNGDSVLKMAKAAAENKGCRLIIPDKSQFRMISSDITGSKFEYKNEKYRISMCGGHQTVNAVTAIETVMLLNDFNISQKNIRDGLIRTKVALRIEFIDGEPKMIIDGGHNEAGINSLTEVLDNSGIAGAVGLFGMVYGKSEEYAVKKLSHYFERVYCADGYIENNIPAGILSDMFLSHGVESVPCDISEGCAKAREYARKAGLLLIVCGSLYMTSRAKKEFGLY